MSEYYLGTMCGTSLDAFDVSIIKTTGTTFKVVGFKSYKISASLTKKIRLQIAKKKKNDALNIEISRYVSQCINKILKSYDINPDKISAVGFCGITLHHDPSRKKSTYIGDPNLITELTKINTIADFRQSDIDSGGQGAPLTGYFQHYLSKKLKKNIVFLNLGGFANITTWKKNQPISYDTGPANYLIDTWCRSKFKQPFDKNGSMASKGEINYDFLNLLMTDKYFISKPPKSTGFEKFNLAWINTQKKKIKKISNLDVLSTLTYLTITTVSIEINKSSNNSSPIYIYGGGVKNKTIVNGIQDLIELKRLQKLPYGLNEKNFESSCFAWLALKRKRSIKFSKSKITGRKVNNLLGNIY